MLHKSVTVRVLFLCIVLASTTSVLGPTRASAGVFNIPRFIPATEYAIGMEPALILTNGAGVDVNLRFNYGVSDLSNVVAILGVGSGTKAFRFGGAYTFDFFPDIVGQPGIGVAVQGIYYNLITGGGVLEATGIPYLHKTFFTESKDEIEPFIAIPLGLAFNSGTYTGLATFVLGAMFKNSEHFRYTVEFGMAVNNTNSYISGGVTYYH